ncbi:MAG TPA: type I-MYXAN CRISPR-associated protein Cas6/Cmx6 [Burkholderiales bacterium]|nr:type I-MYXAN CRISPR-associated protein Cas6/Cmx6 [Burkholderiales bacterium]
MTDILFDLEGGFLPKGYGLLLWKEITLELPWLENQELAGILPLKGSSNAEGLLLPRRAKLALRIPLEHFTNALDLTGKTLDVGGNMLKIGRGKQRQIEAYPTLNSHFVVSDKDEADFLDEAEEKLAEMGISCKLICGRHQTMHFGDELLSGYSLVAHDLKPAGSIRLQHSGLGAHRHIGCGFFAPHKTIAGLE